MISGRTLGRYRPWIVIGVFVFAAVATPSTDPFSMLMLAIPLQILFILAEIVAERRGGGGRPMRELAREREAVTAGAETS